MSLDTGAPYTILSPQALEAAGVVVPKGARTELRRGVVPGAVAEMKKVFIDELAVGSARAGRMIVRVYDLKLRSADGLLGQDFLADFKVSIDAARGVVTLTPR